MARSLRFFLPWQIIALICVLGWTSLAMAHSLNMTGIKILLGKNQITVSAVVHLHNLKTKEPGAEILKRLKLRFNGAPFSPQSPQLIRDPANGIVIWQAQQPSSGQSPPTIDVDAPFFPELAGESTVVTVFKDRQLFKEALVDAAHPTATLGGSEAKASPSRVARRFLGEGITHIFGGIDHVLFLLSLLLLGGTWKQLLKIVTAFTLAHSITLSLAATGVFTLPPRLVEAVIALSIVAVALSNLRATEKKALDFRPWLAFGFGLIHGFGFAGALAEVGLPREALGWALLAFNLGVEIGQATLVLIFAPALLVLIKKWPRLEKPVVRFGSLGVAGMGFFWFVERILSK